MPIALALLALLAADPFPPQHPGKATGKGPSTLCWKWSRESAPDGGTLFCIWAPPHVMTPDAQGHPMRKICAESTGPVLREISARGLPVCPGSVP